jgi:hypothetical protein
MMKNKYSYILDKEIITVKDLIRAYYVSQETNKSVEAILVVYFGVKRKTLGKSLSMYYGCPFKSYDSNLPISLAFFTHLKKSTLLDECWVPYRWGHDGIEVLVEDPWDFTKNEKIRVSLGTTRIKFSVAIKEDIEDFIHRLFNVKANLIYDEEKINYISKTAEIIR